MDEDLKSLAQRAVAATADFPAELRPSLVVEMFRALREGSTALTAHTASITPTGRSAPGRALPTIPESLGEYLAELGEVSHPTRLVAIAAFRYRANNIDALTGEDFMAAYAEVRIPRPQNLSVNIARAMRRGWLVTAERAHTWRVTQRGIQMIDGLTPGGDHE